MAMELSFQPEPTEFPWLARVSGGFLHRVYTVSTGPGEYKAVAGVHLVAGGRTLLLSEGGRSL